MTFWKDTIAGRYPSENKCTKPLLNCWYTWFYLVSKPCDFNRNTISQRVEILYELMLHTTIDSLLIPIYEIPYMYPTLCKMVLSDDCLNIISRWYIYIYIWMEVFWPCDWIAFEFCTCVEIGAWYLNLKLYSSQFWMVLASKMMSI